MQPSSTKETVYLECSLSKSYSQSSSHYTDCALLAAANDRSISEPRA